MAESASSPVPESPPEPRARWRAIVRGGLAVLVIALAVGVLLSHFRETSSPRAPESVGVPKPAIRPPAGPLMRIDPAALARAGRERDDNGLHMKFCWCPPGEFLMGQVSGRLAGASNAGPVSVTLSRGFWMGKFEVTQAQWRQVMGLTLREQRAQDPTQPRPVGDGSMRDHVGEGPDFPIYFTSHADAGAFCRKLTEAERAGSRLEPGWEYQLPTEAQWEFACRAGTTTATAFGERLSSCEANFDGTMPLQGAAIGPYLHETTPVGRYSANAWGLHDMHGNVWEWCRDGFQETLQGGADPFQGTSSSRRTYRGGCWHNPGVLCISTSRGWGEVSNRGSGLGFRVALVQTGP